MPITICVGSILHSRAALRHDGHDGHDKRKSCQNLYLYHEVEALDLAKVLELLQQPVHVGDDPSGNVCAQGQVQLLYEEERPECPNS